MNPTILLVEDSPTEIHILTGYIRSELPHATIVSCDTVAKTMEFLAEKKPTFLILDLNLKEGSGEDVLNHVRSNGMKIPVLVSTGLKSDEALAKLFDLGADDYVLKPIDNLIFQSKIRSLMTAKYVSPLLFQGRPEGIGKLTVSMGIKIVSLDEFNVKLTADFYILAGAKLNLKIEDVSFECKVKQTEPMQTGCNLQCEILSESISDRVGFRRFLLGQKKIANTEAA